MRAFENLPPPPDRPADFAVIVTDDSLLPFLRPGETAYLRRRADLQDGDVGLFWAGDGMVFRQFCQDSQGNVYLFAVNRRRREADLVIPAKSAGGILCYGRVQLDAPVPLPMD